MTHRTLGEEEADQMERLHEAAVEARNWTGPLAAEGDTFFADLDGRILGALYRGDEARLRVVLAEVLGWAEAQADDRSQEDEAGLTEYDPLVQTLHAALQGDAG